VVLLQQRDELVHLRRVEVNACGALSRLGEAGGCARFGDIGHEVQEDEVHVLNFVGAVTHELLGNHAGRHVPADAQPELGLIIDALARLHRRGRQHLHRSFVRAGTVDEFREHSAGRPVRPARYAS